MEQVCAHVGVLDEREVAYLIRQLSELIRRNKELAEVGQIADALQRSQLIVVQILNEAAV